LRTAYKGTLKFGLLAIPIRMGTALDGRPSMFHRMHAECGARVSQQYRCPQCEKTVEYAELGRCVELADGSSAAVTDGELDQLKVWENKTITLEYFCREDEIDPLLFEQHYYMEPVDGGAAAHALLISAIGEGLAAVVTIGYRDKVVLGLLRPQPGGFFVVTTMRWPGELRAADVKLPPVQPPRPQEVKMATQLVRSMTRRFDPAAHANTYRDQLVALVQSKGAQPTGPSAVKPPEKAYADMMDLLQASIAAQKATTAKRPRAAKAS